MTGRERLLTALSNGKPDRLPCQVHSFMQYYLKTYLNGMDQFQAYEFFGMDYVIYDYPQINYSDKSMKEWIHNRKWFAENSDGVREFIDTFQTPKGTLVSKGAINKFTSWETEPMIKTEADFELYREFYPVASGADWGNIIKAKERVGDDGIVRTWHGSYGQPGSWQCLSYLMGTEETIMKTFDDPDWVHYALNIITDKSIRQIDAMGKIQADLTENGGGSASSTVISPSIHREFCLPYDIKVNNALKAQGSKVVYHLCGGLMPLLEIVAQNGADALETMTPPSMGGDCNVKEAAERVGDKLAFIGGFDQNQGFERGTKEYINRTVEELFESKPNGGLIVSPSDHFFFGDVENIKEFVRACKNHKY